MYNGDSGHFSILNEGECGAESGKCPVEGPIFGGVFGDEIGARIQKRR